MGRHETKRASDINVNHSDNTNRPDILRIISQKRAGKGLASSNEIDPRKRRAIGEDGKPLPRSVILVDRSGLLGGVKKAQQLFEDGETSRESENASHHQADSHCAQREYEEIKRNLDKIAEKRLDNNKICVIGGGNAGAAFAADAKLSGRTVALYGTHLQDVIDNNNTLEIEGKKGFNGEVTLDVVTNNLIEATEGAKLLICTIPTDKHKSMAKSLAPVLVDGQVVLLSPGATGGVVEFKKVLKENGCTADILVVESQSIPYACRRAGHKVNISGIKTEVSCAGLPAEKMDEFFSLTKDIYPSFTPCDGGIWATSINNISILFHPIPALLNMARMESGGSFNHYTEGCSPTVCKTIEKVDKERLDLASAMGVSIPTVLEWLKINYNASGRNLYEALQNNEAYQAIKAPQLKNSDDKANLRYITADVPCGLVPISCLAKKFEVKTPTIDLFIKLADLVYDTNFTASGRNLRQLGLEDLSASEIRSMSKSSTT
jgi:opine dehydrogenase